MCGMDGVEQREVVQVPAPVHTYYTYMYYIEILK